MSMVRSMTGFGRAKNQINGFDITVEIKSVNHRYFEFSCRMPRAYNFLEEKIKSWLEEIKVRFEEFNYEDINDSIKEIAYEIENLNDALEKEVTAKDHFNQYIDLVYETIDEIVFRAVRGELDFIRFLNSVFGFDSLPPFLK